MHTMIMINEHEGTEEWLCSSCGRHLLVSWYPNFKRIVLEAGDLSAAHSGFKEDSSMEHMIFVPVDKTHQPEMPEQPGQPMEDPRLAPWIMWMDEVGFENLWNRDVQ
jgi:hypothetical protein